MFKNFWDSSACDLIFLVFRLIFFHFISCWNFILGAPIETERHIKQAIKFACSLPLDIATFNSLIYFYEFDLWFEAKKNEKIDDGIGYSIDADCESNLSNFTFEKLKVFSRKVTQKFCFRPYYIIGEIMKIFRNNDFGFIRTELNYL